MTGENGISRTSMTQFAPLMRDADPEKAHKLATYAWHNMGMIVLVLVAIAGRGQRCVERGVGVCHGVMILRLTHVNRPKRAPIKPRPYSTGEPVQRHCSPGRLTGGQRLSSGPAAADAGR